MRTDLDRIELLICFHKIINPYLTWGRKINNRLYLQPSLIYPYQLKRKEQDQL